MKFDKIYIFNYSPSVTNEYYTQIGFKQHIDLKYASPESVSKKKLQACNSNNSRLIQKISRWRSAPFTLSCGKHGRPII